MKKLTDSKLILFFKGKNIKKIYKIIYILVYINKVKSIKYIDIYMYV
jgi:hypothetical protein